MKPKNHLKKERTEGKDITRLTFKHNLKHNTAHKKNTDGDEDGQTEAAERQTVTKKDRLRERHTERRERKSTSTVGVPSSSNPALLACGPKRGQTTSRVRCHVATRRSGRDGRSRPCS